MTRREARETLPMFWTRVTEWSEGNKYTWAVGWSGRVQYSGLAKRAADGQEAIDRALARLQLR